MTTLEDWQRMKDNEIRAGNWVPKVEFHLKGEEEWQRAKPAVDAWQKAHPLSKVEVERVEAGIYAIHTYESRQSFCLSAQELRDLYDWALLHMREIEEEARRFSQEQPPASLSQ